MGYLKKIRFQVAYFLRGPQSKANREYQKTFSKEWIEPLHQLGLPSPWNQRGNLEGIIEEGLKTRFSLRRPLSYGKGLYFTDSVCKASQYGNIILVCRVVLGKVEVLRSGCSHKLFASDGYHSALGKKRVSQLHTSLLSQLHNEYIIYDERACYPEFVIWYRKNG
eukprot:scaffold6566_cov125-Amphora_coffeaeformis.AAC.4